MPDDDGGFRFVQFDFAGPIGIPDGRWVVRRGGGDQAEHVLVVDARPAGRRPRRAKRIEAEPEPPPAMWSRVTVVDVTGADGPDAEQRRAKALAVVAAAMSAWRVAALDPFAPESPPIPAAVRVGRGSGEQVAHSRWTEASELPVEPRGRRRRRPAPPEGRFAELLGGRSPMPACAVLTLRARLDLESGRPREAVLGAEAAINCAREELAARLSAGRLEALVAHSTAVAAAAAEARAGDPSSEAIEAVRAALERLEASLRAVALLPQV